MERILSQVNGTHPASEILGKGNAGSPRPTWSSLKSLRKLGFVSRASRARDGWEPA